MAGLLSAFTGSFSVSRKVAEFVIVPLDSDGGIDYDLGGAKILQYWPESIDDSHSPNWQSKDIPGLPIPLYQWVSGGERSLSFATTFSRDMSGEIGKDIDQDKHNVDIDAAIAWLRMLSWNDYGTVGNVANAAIAPPVLWICGLGTTESSGMELGHNDSITPVPKVVGSVRSRATGVYCIMTECGAERSNWFQDGTTRYSGVSLAFNEVIQIGTGIYAYGRSAFKQMAARYSRVPS